MTKSHLCLGNKWTNYPYPYPILFYISYVCIIVKEDGCFYCWGSPVLFFFCCQILSKLNSIHKERRKSLQPLLEMFATLQENKNETNKMYIMISKYMKERGSKKKIWPFEFLFKGGQRASRRDIKWPKGTECEHRGWNNPWRGQPDRGCWPIKSQIGSGRIM